MKPTSKSKIGKRRSNRRKTLLIIALAEWSQNQNDNTGTIWILYNSLYQLRNKIIVSQSKTLPNNNQNSIHRKVSATTARILTDIFILYYNRYIFILWAVSNPNTKDNKIIIYNVLFLNRTSGPKLKTEIPIKTFKKLKIKIKRTQYLN